MSEIAPCITVETAEAYKAYVDKIHPFAQRVHIDISDGEFAPTFLLGASQLWWPQEWVVDVHAMVMRPLEHVQALIQLKPHTIIFHAEADREQLAQAVAMVKAAGIRVGIGLLKPTVPSTCQEFIQQADHVMVFSGDLGYYGGKASLMQLEKVRLIKGINPSVEIGWDGGVSMDNAYTLAKGGVAVLNSGGAIANAPDAGAAYAALVKEINKHGVI